MIFDAIHLHQPSSVPLLGLSPHFPHKYLLLPSSFFCLYFSLSIALCPFSVLPSLKHLALISWGLEAFYFVQLSEHCLLPSFILPFLQQMRLHAGICMQAGPLKACHSSAHGQYQLYFYWSNFHQRPGSLWIRARPGLTGGDGVTPRLSPILLSVSYIAHHSLTSYPSSSSSPDFEKSACKCKYKTPFSWRCWRRARWRPQPLWPSAIDTGIFTALFSVSFEWQFSSFHLSW